MDRLAYQNMTSRGKFPISGTEPAPPNHLTQPSNSMSYFDHQHHHSYYQPPPQLPPSQQPQQGGASLNSFSQPTGELTNKSKLNTQLNHYHLERQSKNSSDYGSFVSALNSNISEDQHRTNLNNDRWHTEQQREIDHFQRVYHPTLQYGDSHNLVDMDRQGLGLGTRDKRENAEAKNKNWGGTPHSPPLSSWGETPHSPPLSSWGETPHSPPLSSWGETPHSPPLSSYPQ